MAASEADMDEPPSPSASGDAAEKVDRRTLPISASTLPIVSGKVYHLDIEPRDLADNVIIVGDPDRVIAFAVAFIAHPEFDHCHRGLRTITGNLADGLRVTITTSGMGTPSLEIVFNELVALREIDFATMKPIVPRPPPLNIIRVGTSGALRDDTLLGSLIIAKYAIGLDGTGLYYESPKSESCVRMEHIVDMSLNLFSCEHYRYRSRLHSYVSAGDDAVVGALMQSAMPHSMSAHPIFCKCGITVSAGGFFANQGRWPIERMRPAIPNLDEYLGKLDLSARVLDLISDEKEWAALSGLRIENMEMETSALFHLGAAARYRCGSICVAIAQRRAEKFVDPAVGRRAIEVAGMIAIDALRLLHGPPRTFQDDSSVIKL